MSNKHLKTGLGLIDSFERANSVPSKTDINNDDEEINLHINVPEPNINNIHFYRRHSSTILTHTYCNPYYELYDEIKRIHDQLNLDNRGLQNLAMHELYDLEQRTGIYSKSMRKFFSMHAKDLQEVSGQDDSNSIKWRMKGTPNPITNMVKLWDYILKT